MTVRPVKKCPLKHSNLFGTVSETRRRTSTRLRCVRTLLMHRLDDVSLELITNSSATACTRECKSQTTADEDERRHRKAVSN